MRLSILSCRVTVSSVLIWSVTMIAIVLLTGLVLLLFLYKKSGPAQKDAAGAGEGPPQTPAVAREEAASSTATTHKDKLEELVRPEMETFDLKGCDSDSVALAHPGPPAAEAQRAGAPRAAPGGPFKLPHCRFPRDIPFQVGFPAGAHQVSGFHGLFRLNLIYRSDSELRLHWKLTLETGKNGHKLEVLGCRVAEVNELLAESGLRGIREPRKHVRVGILQRSAEVLRSQNCLMISSSCRFYLSLHRHQVTQPFRAPATRFTHTARPDLENGAPSVALGRDLPDAARLAEFLLSLDADYRYLMSFLKWRQIYNTRRKRTEEKRELLCLS